MTGDASRTTIEKGWALLDYVATSLASLIADLAADPMPDGHQPPEKYHTKRQVWHVLCQ